jgi:cell division septation protein DedD
MGRYKDVAIEQAGLDDEYRGFDAGGEESARGPLILALAVGVMLVFGAVIWNTYRAGVRDELGGVPSILADAAPYKRAPDTPGGIEVPDTDKRFYDQLDASERPQVETASLDVTGPAEALSGGPPMELRPGMAEAAPVSPAISAADIAPLAEAAPAAPEAVEVAPPVASVPAEAEPSPQFAFSGDGQFLVQVAAFRSEAAADDAWRKAAAAEPSLYRGAAKHIQKADLGAKGVFYRLRIGTFAERSEAAAFCTALKDSGSNCIVVSG